MDRLNSLKIHYPRMTQSFSGIQANQNIKSISLLKSCKTVPGYTSTGNTAVLLFELLQRQKILMVSLLSPISHFRKWDGSSCLNISVSMVMYERKLFHSHFLVNSGRSLLSISISVPRWASVKAVWLQWMCSVNINICLNLKFATGYN